MRHYLFEIHDVTNATNIAAYCMRFSLMNMLFVFVLDRFFFEFIIKKLGSQNAYTVDIIEICDAHFTV
jgi:hypothetical protein